MKKVSTIYTTPTIPFNFDATFHKPDHFTTGDNLWEPGVKWQTWRWHTVPLGLKFINVGTVTKPKLQIEVYGKEKLNQQFINSLENEIIYRYNLTLDLSLFYKHFENDPILKPIIEKFNGMRPGHPSSLYEYLIIGIMLQNATVRRSMQMFQNLLNKYGILLEYDKKKLWCFWNPGDLHSVNEEELRDLKVGYRAKSIKKIDDYFSKGELNEMELRTKDRPTQMVELLKLYGVGPATVWYLLFDVFHHWDFFNHVSPWEQKIYSKVFFDKDPEDPVPVEQILKHFEKFGNFKQLAVHYIWENLWWKRKNEHIPWLEQQIRM